MYPNVICVLPKFGLASPFSTVIPLVTLKLDSVPTLVKLEVTTVEFSVVPVNVPAAAVTVPLEPRVIAVPLIFTLVGTLAGVNVNVEPLRLNDPLPLADAVVTE